MKLNETQHTLLDNIHIAIDNKGYKTLVEVYEKYTNIRNAVNSESIRSERPLISHVEVKLNNDPWYRQFENKKHKR